MKINYLQIFILCLVSLFPVPFSAQSFKDEADKFLQNMPVGLQDRQRDAIRMAIHGDNTALRKVRNGRNVSLVLNEKIRTTDISSTLRLYELKNETRKKLPLLIYLHGGGWTIGSINSCARFCSELAATGKVKVLAVEYCLAPENPYPAGLDDCVAALLFAQQHAVEWGCDSGLISVGGDSSGGNLAIATVLRMIAQKGSVPHSLLLFYPVVSAWNDESASWKENDNGMALNGDLMEEFNRAYCRGMNDAICEDEHQNPFVSPSVAPDSLLAELPKTLLIAAERDILRDQGVEFIQHLQSLGVDATRREFSGSVHLFITVIGQESAFWEAVGRSAEFLRR